MARINPETHRRAKNPRQLNAEIYLVNGLLCVQNPFERIKILVFNDSCGSLHTNHGPQNVYMTLNLYEIKIVDAD